MKKVTIFGVGNLGSRIAFFLARSRDISRIRLVDIDPKRTKATVVDFLESNVALRSKIMFVDYDEPKEIDQSDVVIVAAGVGQPAQSEVTLPGDADLRRMEEIAAHIGHFAPQAMVAVLSQPTELFCSVIARSGYLSPERVFGFPLLIYREWFRDRISRIVGLGSQDIRISTVRTLQGEELVPSQCAVSGIPLSVLVDDPSTIPVLPDADVMKKRLKYHNYAPAAVVSEVTSEIVGKRRQLITAVCPDSQTGAFLESKAVFGPDGLERVLPLDLTDDQRRRHDEYRSRVVSLTEQLTQTQPV
jgi:malate dehydrogenase